MLRNLAPTAAALGVGMAAVSTAQADTVDIQGLVAASAEQTGATFAGTLEYNFISGTTGELKVSLSNESPIAVGGFLTGFLFRSDDVTGASMVSSTHSGMTSTGVESASPFGMFDGGAAVGGSFLGGGNPSQGMGVGDSGMFVFSVASATASTLSAADFLGSLDEPGFVVRFRGLADGGSDKVPGFQVVVPLPGAGALAAVGLAAVGMRRRR